MRAAAIFQMSRMSRTSIAKALRRAAIADRAATVDVEEIAAETVAVAEGALVAAAVVADAVDAAAVVDVTAEVAMADTVATAADDTSANCRVAIFD